MKIENLIIMTIGVDGNEANIKNRVGSGQYAFELLKQFHSLSSWREQQRPIGSSQILSRSSPSSAAKGSRMTSVSTNYHFVIYLKDQPLPDLPKETANFKYQVFGPKKLWTQFALPIKLIFGKKPDVFFSMAHYGPRFSRVPYVVTIHDLSYLHFPQMFRKSDLVQLTSWSKYSIKNASHIIAVSQTTKDDIIKNYGVDQAKITVTYEGYDKDRFKPQPKQTIESIKKKYKIKGSYIIFVGTLQPRKNLERLIEAFNQILHQTTPGVDSDSPGVKKDLANLQLVIAGKKGWMYDQIFQKVKDLSLEDKVIFTDYVPDEDLPALISSAKAYILPSLWEGFGVPVIEAQACGVPVVVSNTSSLPEIIGADPSTPGVGSRRHPKNTPGVSLKNNEAVVSGSGILVDPKNVDSIASGIKKALNDKVRSDLINRGYQNIKRFSWQTCAQETLGVLVKVASR